MPSSATKVIIIEETGEIAMPIGGPVQVTKQTTLDIPAGASATLIGELVEGAVREMERRS